MLVVGVGGGVVLRLRSPFVLEHKRAAHVAHAANTARVARAAHTSVQQRVTSHSDSVRVSSSTGVSERGQLIDSNDTADDDDDDDDAGMSVLTARTDAAMEDTWQRRGERTLLGIIAAITVKLVFSLAIVPAGQLATLGYAPYIALLAQLLAIVLVLVARAPVLAASLWLLLMNGAMTCVSVRLLSPTMYFAAFATFSNLPMAVVPRSRARARAALQALAIACAIVTSLLRHALALHAAASADAAGDAGALTWADVGIALRVIGSVLTNRTAVTDALFHGIALSVLSAVIAIVWLRSEDAHLNLQHLLSRMRRLAAEREAARRAAIDAAAARMMFVANVSHELRTPVTGILGASELLLSLPLADDQRELAELVASSSVGLLHIVNEVLDFARLEQHKVELETIVIDVAALVESALDVVSFQASKKGLRLLWNVSDAVPLVTGDAQRLRQVLVNLLGNAIKFTERGHVRVRVSREAALPVVPAGAAADAADATDACVLHFACSDSGAGIAADKLGSIFQSFVQENASVARRFGGSGLGLSICRQLVEMMGGRIWVESELGRGSTFHFTVVLREHVSRRHSGADQAALLERDGGHGDASSSGYADAPSLSTVVGMEALAAARARSSSGTASRSLPPAPLPLAAPRRSVGDDDEPFESSSAPASPSRSSASGFVVRAPKLARSGTGASMSLRRRVSSRSLISDMSVSEASPQPKSALSSSRVSGGSPPTPAGTVSPERTHGGPPSSTLSTLSSSAVASAETRASASASATVMPAAAAGTFAAIGTPHVDAVAATAVAAVSARSQAPSGVTGGGGSPALGTAPDEDAPPVPPPMSEPAPRARVATVTSASYSVSTDDVPSAAHAMAGVRVCVISDDDALVASLVEQLRQSDFSCDAACAADVLASSWCSQPQASAHAFLVDNRVGGASDVGASFGGGGGGADGGSVLRACADVLAALPQRPSLVLVASVTEKPVAWCEPFDSALLVPVKRLALRTLHRFVREAAGLRSTRADGASYDSVPVRQWRSDSAPAQTTVDEQDGVGHGAGAMASIASSDDGAVAVPSASASSAAAAGGPAHVRVSQAPGRIVWATPTATAAVTMPAGTHVPLPAAVDAIGALVPLAVERSRRESALSAALTSASASAAPASPVHVPPVRTTPATPAPMHASGSFVMRGIEIRSSTQHGSLGSATAAGGTLSPADSAEQLGASTWDAILACDVMVPFGSQGAPSSRAVSHAGGALGSSASASVLDTGSMPMLAPVLSTSSTADHSPAPGRVALVSAGAAAPAAPSSGGVESHMSSRSTIPGPGAGDALNTSSTGGALGSGASSTRRVGARPPLPPAAPSKPATHAVAPDDDGGIAPRQPGASGAAAGAERARPDEDETLEAPAAAPAAAVPRASARILVADDFAPNRFVLAKMLGTLGVETVSVCDGREAVEAVAAAGVGAFDVILLDIEMPIMNGLEATRQLRALGVTVPIVALTAHTTFELWRDAGMTDSIVKPFTLHGLRRRLASFVPALLQRRA